MASVAQFVGVLAYIQKVMGSIPGQGTYPDSGFSPGPGDHDP